MNVSMVSLEIVGTAKRLSDVEMVKMYSKFLEAEEC